MTLTTHAIVGAAIATAVPSHQALAFVLGFASHFVLDSLPHWDYKLRSAVRTADDHVTDMTMDKNFAYDLSRIFLDVVLGFAVAFLAFGVFKLPIWLWWHSAVVWGAIGGVAPDALQFVYFKWKHWPITALQRFHMWCDERSENIQDRPILGISTQILVIMIAIVLARSF